MLDIATEKERTEKIYTIRLRGKLDAITARDFETFYEDMIRAGHRYFIFDGALLEFVSSAGIGSMVRFARKMDHLHGKAAFYDLNQEIELLFTFFGLNEHIPLFAMEEEATLFMERFIQEKGADLKLEVKDHHRIGSDSSSSEKRSDVFLQDRSEQDFSGADEQPATNRMDLPSQVSRRESGVQQAGAKPQGQFVSPVSPSSAVAPPGKAPGGGAAPMEGHSTVSDEGIDLEMDAPSEQKIREEQTGSRASDVPPPVPQEEDDEDIEIIPPPPPESFLPQMNQDERSEAQIEKELDDGNGYRIIQCEQCHVNLRVYHTGRHMCPSCNIEFHIKKNGEISYFEKL